MKVLLAQNLLLFCVSENLSPIKSKSKTSQNAIQTLTTTTNSTLPLPIYETTIDASLRFLRLNSNNLKLRKNTNYSANNTMLPQQHQLWRIHSLPVSAETRRRQTVATLPLRRQLRRRRLLNSTSRLPRQAQFLPHESQWPRATPTTTNNKPRK